MTARFHKARGFSLVELMVSVVIGMLALLFATRLLTGAEQNRQSAMGGSDSMQSGMLALFSISSDAGQAGYGINNKLAIGCNTIFSDKGGFTLAAASRDATAIHPMAPVVIESNAGGADKVTFYSGTSVAGTASLRVLVSYTSGSRIYVDRVPYGFAQGDAILVVPEPAGTDCALAQLSESPDSLPPPPGQQYVVVGEGSGYRFNTGNLGASFTGSGARLFNLGPAQALYFHTWSVADGFLSLSATNIGSNAAAAAVADNIVSLKAQYGFDTRPGNAFQPAIGLQVTQWSSTMIDADGSAVTGDAGDWQRIAAVRLAVVARSKNPERPAAGTSCSATADADKPVAFGTKAPAGVAAVQVTINVAVTGDAVDWHCYRYRVFETIVPFRNASWRP
jgi:type IV pilus assembly protein PilW